jgi:hypothetical protein
VERIVDFKESGGREYGRSSIPPRGEARVLPVAQYRRKAETTEDKIEASIRDCLAEIKESRKRARATGRRIKKLETKTRSIISKL